MGLGLGLLFFYVLVTSPNNSSHRDYIHQQVIDARQERAYDKMLRGERLTETDVYDLAARPD